jgi:serine/threonine-protein kinase
MLDGLPSAETVREQLEHILASSRFRASEPLRRLLRYTVEAALAGRGDSLKEYTLGVEALGRAESFDPRQDTIVRVQARKLRERLAAYSAARSLERSGHARSG